MELTAVIRDLSNLTITKTYRKNDQNYHGAAHNHGRSELKLGRAIRRPQLKGAYLKNVELLKYVYRLCVSVI